MNTKELKSELASIYGMASAFRLLDTHDCTPATIQTAKDTGIMIQKAIEMLIVKLNTPQSATGSEKSALLTPEQKTELERLYNLGLKFTGMQLIRSIFGCSLREANLHYERRIWKE